MSKKKKKPNVVNKNKKDISSPTAPIASTKRFIDQLGTWDKEMFMLNAKFANNMTGIKETYLISHNSLMNELKLLDTINKNKLSSKNISYQKDLNKLTKLIINNQNNSDLELSLQIQTSKDKFSQSIRILDESLYVLLFSRYEANLEKLYDIFSTKNPGSINYEHKFSTRDMKEFSSLSEAERYVQEATINHQMRKSRKKQLEWMKDQKIEVGLEDGDIKSFDMYYSFRNCIVHADSILREEDIEFIKKFEGVENPLSEKDINYYNELKGGKLDLDEEIFLVTLVNLCILGNIIALAFWQKIHKSKSDLLFLLIASVWSNYFVHEEYGICAVIFKKLLESKLERRYIDEVNCILTYCVSLKLEGQKQDNYLEELKKIEWQDLSDGVLILKYGILDDVEGVIKCMIRIGKNNLINMLNDLMPLKYLLMWGYFDGVRDNPKYLKAYEEIFKND